MAASRVARRCARRRAPRAAPYDGQQSYGNQQSYGPQATWQPSGFDDRPANYGAHGYGQQSYQMMQPYPPQACGPGPYALQAPVAPARYGQPPPCPQELNPLGSVLAPGLLGGATAAALADDASALAMDLAGSLFATALAGKISGINLAGGGFAIGGSFVPTLQSRLEVLRECETRPGMWYVCSYQAIGGAGSIAVGGGMAVLGGGVMAGAAFENAWTYMALVPTHVARALVPQTEQGTLMRVLDDATGGRLVRWPDFSKLDNLGVGEAVRTSHMRRGTVGIVVSTMLQNGVGYMSLSGTFEQVAWRQNERFVQISEAATHVTECGVAAGFSVVEKIDMRRENTQAARVTLSFDTHNPTSRALAEGILQKTRAFPISSAPKADGSWQQRFFHDLPEGVTPVKLETVQQHTHHVGGGLFDSVAKYLHASGLGLSFDGMRDAREEVDVVGTLNSETAAHLAQTGVLWLGTDSRLVFVNAQYGRLHGQSEPVFLGLVLGMQYEITHVRGTNRNAFLDDFNASFGLDLPQFEKIASHSGYYVSVKRLLSAGDLERLTRLDETSLHTAGVTDPKRIRKVLRLRDLLHDAHRQGTAGPRLDQAQGGFQPLLLCEAAVSGASAISNDERDPAELAIARARVMQDQITGIKTLGAVCRFLGGDDDTLQVRVRHGACEKPLEGMRTFNLVCSGEHAKVRSDDALADVQRRFTRAQKLRAQLDRGLEALGKDVLGNTFANDANEAIGRRLLAAYVDLDNALDLEHLTHRQQIALLRQDDIFKLLPVTARAQALCLYDRTACRGVTDTLRERTHKALKVERERLESLVIPGSLESLRAALVQLVDEAGANLATSMPDPFARTWGQPWPVTVPEDRLMAAQAAAARGDALCKLPAYDIHILVQDNAAMSAHQGEVRDAIAAIIDVARPYDPQGVIDVQLVSEQLAQTPAYRLMHPGDAHDLTWTQSGTNALVGNALESALENFVVEARRVPTHKYAAYIVLTTGAMSDAPVVTQALERVKEAIANFEDEVCVGFLQLKHDRRDGTNIVAQLDTNSRVGNLIESNTQVELPVQQRVVPLLTGMLNPEHDDANDTANKAQAVVDGFARLGLWGRR